VVDLSRNATNRFRIIRGERADRTLCRTLRLRLSNELAAKWCTKETVAPVNAEGELLGRGWDPR
jgi:hypothetical protein